MGKFLNQFENRSMGRDFVQLGVREIAVIFDLSIFDTGGVTWWVTSFAARVVCGPGDAGEKKVLLLVWVTVL